MSEAIREQSERRIASPEELHDYMHVTGPALWIMLTVIIVLLAGLIIVASTITMENTMDVQVEVIDNSQEGRLPVMACTLTGERRNQVKIGMKVRVAGEEGTITTLVEDEQEVTAMIAPPQTTTGLKTGTYDAQIVLESTTPVSFLLKQ